jgi:hypothetical protein
MQPNFRSALHALIAQAFRCAIIGMGVETTNQMFHDVSMPLLEE